MPPTVAELGAPPLRKTWQDAKKKSEEAAKKSKEIDKLADLHKKKMKAELGPDLENWPKKYPDWSKLQELKKKIDGTLHTYQDAVKNSGLTDPVKKPMATALTEIKTAMDDRLEKAELLVSSNLKLAVKLSVKTITPIKVFQLDVAKQVDAKAPHTKYKPDKILIELILSDDKILKHVPSDLDDGKLAEQIRNAASFSTIVDELAKLLTSVSDLDLNAANRKFVDGMDKIIGDAMDRAAKPILELVKVRSDHNSYVFKKAATLTLATAGIVASIASLATTPFTGGASGIIACIGLAKSISTLTVEATNLMMKAETFIVKVGDDIKTLNDQYLTVSGTVVGVGELGKTTVNSVVGPFFTTITNAKADCAQVMDKINTLDVKSHDKAQKLGALLTNQKGMQNAVAAFENSNRGQLTPYETQTLQAIKAAIEKTAKPVDNLIHSIQSLTQRVEKNKTDYALLKRAIDYLAAKEPTWAKVGEVLIKTCASIGFIVGGNVNAPEATELLKLGHTIAENSSRVLESLEVAKGLIEDLEGSIRKHLKK